MTAIRPYGCLGWSGVFGGALTNISLGSEKTEGPTYRFKEKYDKNLHNPVKNFNTVLYQPKWAEKLQSVLQIYPRNKWKSFRSHFLHGCRLRWGNWHTWGRTRHAVSKESQAMKVAFKGRTISARYSPWRTTDVVAWLRDSTRWKGEVAAHWLTALVWPTPPTTWRTLRRKSQMSSSFLQWLRHQIFRRQLLKGKLHCCYAWWKTFGWFVCRYFVKEAGFDHPVTKVLPGQNSRKFILGIYQCVFYNPSVTICMKCPSTDGIEIYPQLLSCRSKKSASEYGRINHWYLISWIVYDAEKLKVFLRITQRFHLFFSPLPRHNARSIYHYLRCKDKATEGFKQIAHWALSYTGWWPLLY